MDNQNWIDREDREIEHLRQLHEDAGGEIFPTPDWNMIGDKMRRLTTAEETRLTAYHEAGHALICHAESMALVEDHDQSHLYWPPSVDAIGMLLVRCESRA